MIRTILRSLILPLLANTGLLSAQILYVPSGDVGTSSNGNVGIGTAGPSTTLQLFDANPVLSVVTQSGEFGRTSGIDFYGTFGLAANGDKGGRRFAQIRVGSATPLAWEGAYLSILGITPDGGSPNEILHINTYYGNVGIGTSSPQAGLDIWKSYSAGTDSLRFSYNDGNDYWMGIQPYVVGAANVGYRFRTNNVNTTVDALAITGTGNIGIGTTSPTHKLAVNGTVRAKEVIVDTGWADYVFADDYQLAPLDEVEAHIREKKHLPGIPSAQEVAEHGVSLGEMQSLLLAKIEEMTLHLIRIEKENAALRLEVDALKESAHK